MPSLTAKTVAAIATTVPSMTGDGENLWLRVDGSGRRSWLVRFTSPVTGKVRELTIGSYPAVSLADARAARDQAKALIRAGTDPLDERHGQTGNQPDPAGGLTFRAATERTISAKASGWDDPKGERTWRNSLTTHAYPVLGDISCRDITAQHVLAVLQPIWPTKTTTATRVRERIEAVLDYAAVVEGWNERANVARWKGNLAALLAKPEDVHEVQHHASMRFTEAPAFMQTLRTKQGIGARALELVILTGNRTFPVIAAEWPEVDWQARVWTCPASKMKGKKPHRVPLTAAMLGLLESMKLLRRADAPFGQDWVFPGLKKGQHISNMTMGKVLRAAGLGHLTVHGFRSTLRTWAADATHHREDIAKAVLAHSRGNQTDQAYNRGELFDLRRKLHEDWEAFLGA